MLSSPYGNRRPFRDPKCVSHRVSADEAARAEPHGRLDRRDIQWAFASGQLDLARCSEDNDRCRSQEWLRWAIARSGFRTPEVLRITQTRLSLAHISIWWLAMSDRSTEIDRLLLDAGRRPQEGVSGLLKMYRPRLRRMVRLRLDRRLAGRIDPSDVIQEAYAEAWRRLEGYLKEPKMPFFLWLRSITAQSLLVLHRHHLGVHARDASREISLQWGGLPEATSAALAHQLVAQHTSPTKAARRAEMKLRLEEAFNAIKPMDREVLALRHFEQLTNAETAQTLGIDPSASSKRYVRALRRLKQSLAALGGDLESLLP